MLNKNLMVFVVLFVTYANMINAEEVVLGYFINDPHITTNSASGKPEGSLVDFLEQVIAPEMGVTFKFVHQPLARTLNSMKRGKIDGAVLFAQNQDRANEHNYPKNSFFKMQSTIIVKKHHPLNSITSEEDIRGLEISYAVDAIITPFVKSADVQMYLIGGNDPLLRNLKKLQGGRTQAVFWPDETSVIYTINKLNINEYVKTLTIPENKIALFTIFSKTSNSPNLAARYDQAFEKIDGSKRYAEIINNYIR